MCLFKCNEVLRSENFRNKNYIYRIIQVFHNRSPHCGHIVVLFAAMVYLMKGPQAMYLCKHAINLSVGRKEK